jgi:hypothetical protein
MAKEENFEFYNQFPEMIPHSIKMEEPNENIPIYQGKFSIRREDKITSLEGTVSFDWVPSIKVGFKAIVLESQINFVNLLDFKPSIITELIINNHVFGKCRISGTTIAKVNRIEGFMIEDSVLGDKSISVSSIRFALPNFKEMEGGPIKLSSQDRVQFCRGRILLKNQIYSITIDSLPNYGDLRDKLRAKGGYLIQYHGEIVKITGSIDYTNLKEITSCLSAFLSFVNGRKCNTLFHEGIHENGSIWNDFSPYMVDIFQTVFTWSIDNEISGLNDVWINFYNLWTSKQSQDFLDSVIHWYLEANKNSGYVEGSIIMTQIGLELIYNWYVIEKRKLILGKDADNISASNKIRLLLSQINVVPDLPEGLKFLKEFMLENDMPDGIDAFVQIRNSLVHSQEDKRKKISEINSAVLYEALELGLWYLELSILKVLNYNGNYQFRCSNTNAFESNYKKVPWATE